MRTFDTLRESSRLFRMSDKRVQVTLRLQEDDIARADDILTKMDPVIAAHLTRAGLLAACLTRGLTVFEEEISLRGEKPSPRRPSQLQLAATSAVLSRAPERTPPKPSGTKRPKSRKPGAGT